jgi:hypothetical protein
LRLAKILTHVDSPWLASYDDADFIRNLYSSTRYQYVYTDYQAGNLKRGMRELLLSNLKIPPGRLKTGIPNNEDIPITVSEMSVVLWWILRLYYTRFILWAVSF